MAFPQHINKPLSVFKILNEAFKLPTKNFSLILPILLLSFISSTILFIFTYFSLNPITADFMSNSMSIATLDPKSPEYALIQANIMKDMGELFGMEAILITITFIVSSLVTIATLHAFSLICTSSGKLNDLLFRLRMGLKGPMITTLYVKLFSLGFLFLLISIFGIFVLIAKGSMILIASGVILFFLGLAWYIYLAIVWSVGVVISVADEEGCYGLDAISKAVKIIRGKRRQAIVLALIQIMIAFIAYVIYYLVKGYVPPTMIPQIGMGAVYAAVGAVASMFEWAMIMVFYCDCKRSNGEDGIDVGGFIYGSVPTADYDGHEGALP